MIQELCQNRRRRMNRGSERGMTLIEIMIVIIIMAMIATGVSLAVFGQMEKARIKEAQRAACTIRSAVQLFIAETPNSCPTMDELKEGKYLDNKKSTLDPWNREFVISCEDDPDVHSTGEDGSGRIACENEKKGN